MGYCFSWGGKTWGGDSPGWGAFSQWLVDHGSDPEVWIANHPAAAQCIGALGHLIPGGTAGIPAYTPPAPLPPPPAPAPAPPPAPEPPSAPTPPPDSSAPPDLGGYSLPPDYPVPPGYSAVPPGMYGVPAQPSGSAPTAPASSPVVRDPTKAALDAVIIPSYVDAILSDTGYPMTQINRVAIALWARSEVMPLGENNPLAATDVPYGSQDNAVNSDGVQRYDSIAQASAIYGMKWRSGTYAGIGDALRAGDDLVAIFVAINSSPWCAGCQGGEYPNWLYNLVNGIGKGPVKTSGGTTGRDVSTPQPPIPALITLTMSDVTSGWHRLVSAIGIDIPDATDIIQSAREQIERSVN